MAGEGSACTVAPARCTVTQEGEALVVEEGLAYSLLGMSYLGKLQSFEATRTSLILKP